MLMKPSGLLIRKGIPIVFIGTAVPYSINFAGTQTMQQGSFRILEMPTRVIITINIHDGRFSP